MKQVNVDINIPEKVLVGYLLNATRVISGLYACLIPTNLIDIFFFPDEGERKRSEK